MARSSFSLETGQRKIVLDGGTNPRYAASGHIVYARAGAIQAVPFDLTKFEVTGPAMTLIEGIRIEEWGAAQFALSLEGTLVYVSGGPAKIGKLTWVDRHRTTTHSEPRQRPLAVSVFLQTANGSPCRLQQRRATSGFMS